MRWVTGLMVLLVLLSLPLSAGAGEAFVAQVTAIKAAVDPKSMAERPALAALLANPLPSSPFEPAAQPSSSGSAGNASVVAQSGTNNSATVAQAGQANQSVVAQHGSGNIAVVSQHSGAH